MDLTLKEIAESIARLDGREVEAVHNQLRNPLLKALLRAKPNSRGKGSAAKFDQVELIRARLLVTGGELFGLTTEQLSLINDALSAPVQFGTIGRKVVQPNSFGEIHPATALGALINGALAGEDWAIRLRYVRFPDGARDTLVWVKWSEWDDPETSRLSAGGFVAGSLTLNAAALIRPLVGVPE